MEALNKNKEEIEKILKEIKETIEFAHSCLDCERVELAYIRRNILIKELQGRIKTSILWCEDEIEFLESLSQGTVYTSETYKKDLNKITKKVKQLQTHLTWLKEQEKKS